jgi:hypothetical protein
LASWRQRVVAMLRRCFVGGAAFHSSLITILLADQTGIRGGEIKKKNPFFVQSG